MVEFVPEAWKSLWVKWDIRVFMVISLILQTLLVLVAPLRKKTSRSWVIVPLWSAYLLSDWAANFGLALITSSNGSPTTKDKTSTDHDLLALWATFCLVHLGGPDTITSFALEDNELWPRHLFSLLSQCTVAVYVFFQALPVKQELWFPTILMFLAGIIKYSQRTRSLYLASSSGFRYSMLTNPNPGPDYAKLMEVYYSKQMNGIPTQIHMLPVPDREVVRAASRPPHGPLKDVHVLQYAYKFFETFKGTVVDLIFSFRERDLSQDFFIARSAADAFAVVEVELNFLYEVLFTKRPVLYNGLGYCCRCISSIAVIVSLILFYHLDKKCFEGYDVKITYILLIGTITLDVIAFLMFLFSDRIIVALLQKSSLDVNSSTNFRSNRILSWLCKIKTRSFMSSCLPITYRRWGETMSTYNLIQYCLNKRPRYRELCFGYVGITTFLDEFWYVVCKRFNVTLRNFIFEELKVKSKTALDLDTANEISSSRGEWVIQQSDYKEVLMPFISDVEYDESLLLWHIATDLCYYDEKDVPLNNDYREIAKLISDHMIYLLLMQPKMMTPVSGIGLIRFRDTCAEATKFFKNNNITLRKSGFNIFCREEMPDPEVSRAYKSILDVPVIVPPATVKGIESKSVLFDAARLAHVLIELPHTLSYKFGGEEKVDKWFIMSEVWVEMLSYAAARIRSDSHAQQLSRGGQLVTIVWLLMTHFGLRNQFLEEPVRAKFTMKK